MNPSRDADTILCLALDMLDHSSHEHGLKKVLATFGKVNRKYEIFTHNM